MMKHPNCPVLLVTALSFAAFASCVNPDYDLSQGIDTEMTLIPGKTIPVGDFKPITLRSLIGEGQSDSVLSEDEKGNLSLSFTGDPVSNTYSVPQINLGQLVTSGTTHVTMPQVNIPPIPGGQPTTILPDQNGYQVDPAKTTWAFQGEHTGIPEEIKDIYGATVNTEFILSLKYQDFPVHNIYLAAGSKIMVPPFLIIDPERIPAPFRLDKATNALVLDKEMAVPENIGTTVTIGVSGVDRTKMKEGQGLVAPGHFKVDDSISLDFRVYVKSTEIYSDGFHTPILEFTINTTDVDLISISGKFEPELDIEVPPVKIEGLPPFLDSKTILDLEGLRINLKGTNSFSIGGALSTAITPVIAGKPGKPVTIGPLEVAAAGTTALSLSEKGQGAEVPYTDVAVPGLDRLVYQIPDELSISKPAITFNDSPCLLEMKKDYLFSMEYVITAPLAFGPDLDFQMDQDIALNLDMTQTGIQKIRLDLEAVNALPLDFQIIPKVLDAQNNEVGNVRVTTTSVLKAGSIETPSTNPVQLLLEADQPILLENLRLSLKATGADHAQAVMNMNQYLELKNLKITLPDGITLDPNA